MGLFSATASLTFGRLIDSIGYSIAPYIVAAAYGIGTILVLFAYRNGKKYRSEWTE